MIFAQKIYVLKIRLITMDAISRLKLSYFEMRIYILFLSKAPYLVLQSYLRGYSFLFSI